MKLKLLMFLSMLIALSSFVSALNLENGLTSYWKFENNAYDYYNLNNGSAYGVSYDATGIIGGNYDYDGTDDTDYIDMNFQTTGTTTINLWINPDTVTGLDWFVCDRTAGGAFIQVYRNADLIGYEISNNNYIASGAGTITINDWHMITLIWGAQGQKLYINGALEASDAGTSTYTSTSDIELGIVRTALGNGYAWDGEMDEMGWWSRTLNQTEITYLYNSGAPGSAQQPPFTAADSTPPTISDINCTSPSPDDTSPPFWTKDDTPTFSLLTDENANCYISDTNSSYANCSTTGGRKDHICTINSTQALNDNTDYIYINCTDSSDNSATFKYEMFVDTIVPVITFNSPSSQTYYDTKTTTFSFTGYDNIKVKYIKTYANSSLMAQNYSVVNNTAWVFDITFTDYTNYSVKSLIADNVSNPVYSEIRWFNFIDNPPKISSVTPSSQTYQDTLTVSLSVTAEDNVSLSNVKLFVNGTLNITNSTIVNNTVWNYDLTVHAYTNFSIIFEAEDSSGSKVNSSSYWYNFVDNVPTCTFNSPASQTYQVVSLSAISLNATGMDNVSLFNLSYYADGVLKVTNSSPTNNTPWIVDFTPSAYTNYSINFIACDSSDNCVNSSSRWFNFDQSGVYANLSIGGYERNVSAELGSIITIFGNTSVSGGTICVDVDHPSYGDNYSCGTNSTTFDLNITWFSRTTLSNDSTWANLTYAGSANHTINISAHQYDEVVNMTINLTGYISGTFPKDVKIYVNDTLSNNIGLLFNTSSLTLEEFSDGTSASNTTYPDPATKISAYLYLPTSANITNAIMNVSGYNGTFKRVMASDLGNQEEFKFNSDKEDIPTAIQYHMSISNWNNVDIIWCYDGINWLSYDPDSPDFMNDLIHIENNWSCYIGLNDQDVHIDYFYHSHIGLPDLGNFTYNYDNETVLSAMRFRVDNWTNIKEIYAKTGTDAWRGCAVSGDDCFGTLTEIGKGDLMYVLTQDDGPYDLLELNFSHNPWIETGMLNGTRDWTYTGEFNITDNQTSDFSTKLMSALTSCTADSTGYCTLPIYVYSTAGAEIEISDIYVEYEYTPNPIKIDTDLIQTFLDNSFNATTIPLVIESSQAGIIKADDIQYDYAGGNDAIEIVAHNGTYGFNTTHYITYYYSDWDYDFPPYIEYIEFIPYQGPTQKNVKPYGQTSKIPILNITSTAYGGKTFNFSINMNSSHTCVNDTVSLTSTKSDGTQLTNGTWINHTTAVDYLDSFSIFSWADFECTYSTWHLWEPWWYFRACCTGCDICDDTVNNILEA